MANKKSDTREWRGTIGMEEYNEMLEMLKTYGLHDVVVTIKVVNRDVV